MIEQLDVPLQKEGGRRGKRLKIEGREAGHTDKDFITYLKIDSKYTIHGNVKWKTTKYVEENIEETLIYVRFGEKCLNTRLISIMIHKRKSW